MFLFIKKKKIPRKGLCFLRVPTSGYRKLSSTSGVPEEPSRASLSLVSSSLSSSGRVSAVSWDRESVSSSRARELRGEQKAQHDTEHSVTYDSQRDVSCLLFLVFHLPLSDHNASLYNLVIWWFALCILKNNAYFLCRPFRCEVLLVFLLLSIHCWADLMFFFSVTQPLNIQPSLLFIVWKASFAQQQFVCRWSKLLFSA